jgi:hypothetical protein
MDDRDKPAMIASKQFNMTGTRYSANPGAVEI